MQSGDIPTRFPIPFADSAVAPYTHEVPEASQISVTSGAASLTDGFPPANFSPISAGGVPPFGNDMNGILKQITQWCRWQAAGGPIPWDSAFATSINGYPKGALVASDTFGQYFRCDVEGNTTDPNTGGADWTEYGIPDDIYGEAPPQTGGYLQFTSSSVLTLAPVNGGSLWIDGINYEIQASLNLSNSGLSISTLYYVYAYMNSGVMTLEDSATAYTVASNGIPQKTGDVTRTLVGMIYTTAAGVFSDTDGARQVLSYFNRKTKRSRTQFSQIRNLLTPLTFTEVNTEIRNYFLCWSGDNVQMYSTGQVITSAAPCEFGAALGVDSATVAQLEAFHTTIAGVSNGSASIAMNFLKTGLSEGLHYSTLLGVVDRTSQTSWQFQTAALTAAVVLNVNVNG